MGNKLTAVSLFSGCGGFDLGAQQAGVEVIWANDINPHAAAAYRSLFGSVDFQLKDIADVAHFPRADILIGCYPCTGYSVAARRRWRDQSSGELVARHLRQDEGNYLYWHFLRALSLVRPRYAFIENVGGMTSAEDGYFLEEQRYHFRRLHYDAVISTLQASNFGVPQSRERLFIALTHYDVRPFKYGFPRPSEGPGNALRQTVLRDAIWGMDEWPHGEFNDKPFHGHYLTRNRKRSWDEISYTIVAHGGHVPLHPMGEPMIPVGKDEWALQGNQNRRLSWRECALIQGLPATVAPSGGLRQKYQVVGNAVPPAFGKALLEPIISYEAGLGPRGHLKTTWR